MFECIVLYMKMSQTNSDLQNLHDYGMALQSSNTFLQSSEV